MKREISQRWVLSFADLALLLVAFFVMMQAQVSDRLKLAAGMRGAFGGQGEAAGADASIEGVRAATIFEPGEAILKPAEAARLKALGASRQLGTRRRAYHGGRARDQDGWHARCQDRDCDPADASKRARQRATHHNPAARQLGKRRVNHLFADTRLCRDPCPGVPP